MRRDEPRLYKVGRIWKTWVYVDGRRVKVSTGKRTRAAAAIEARRIEETAADPARAAAQATTVEDALWESLSFKREQVVAGDRSADTVQMYERKNGQLVRLLGADTPLATFCNSAPLDAYVSARRREKVKDATIYKELVVFRSALKLAKRRGLWSGDLDAVLPQVAPKYVPRRTTISAPDLDQVLGELTADDAARASFMVATGAEMRATVRAQRADVGFSFVALHGTKRTSRDRVVPIVLPWQRSLLAHTLLLAQGKDRLFAGDADKFRWALRYACRRAGVDHVTPNDLRRTYASELRRAGALLETIAPTMGHADTRMLERVYAALPPALIAERLRAELGIRDTIGTTASSQDASRETGETPKGADSMPRGGIEPPTRGFSVHGPNWHFPRETPALSAAVAAHRRRIGTAALRVVK
jgi:integrase